MIDFHELSSASDLPAPEGSEVSFLPHPHATVALHLEDDDDEDDDRSGMRWLLERPEALLDLRDYREDRPRRRARPHHDERWLR